jgi:hypothetical protein
MMPSPKIRDLIEKYVRENIFPVAVPLLEEPDTAQNTIINANRRNINGSAEQNRSADEITNVAEIKTLVSTRDNSPFRFFLDGCRRTYYLCDLATDSGIVVPLVAGQYSSAVVDRNNATGNIKLYKHHRQSIVIILAGANGLNSDDADALCTDINNRFPNKEFVAKKVIPSYQVNSDKPSDKSIAQIQMEMHELEVRFLEEMTTNREIDDTKMIIVDGPLQFRLAKDRNRAFLQYAVGVSKTFDLYAEGVVKKDKQIGSHLLKLNHIGDRTSAYVLQDKSSGMIYVYWYLRIQPKKYQQYPYSGIIRIEKALLDTREKEDHLISSDIVNYLSCHLLRERTVNPYGTDFRWASHLYPVYLSEQIQKRKFISNHYFYNLLKK